MSPDIKLLEKIMDIFKGVFRSAELRLKKTVASRQSRSLSLSRVCYRIVTNSDRALMEVIREGRLNPLGDYSLRKFSGDRIYRDKITALDGLVSAVTLAEAYAAARRKWQKPPVSRSLTDIMCF